MAPPIPELKSDQNGIETMKSMIIPAAMFC